DPCINDPALDISLTPDPPIPNQEFFIGVSQTVSTSISDGFVTIESIDGSLKQSQVCIIPATNAGDNFLVNCALDALPNTPPLPINIQVFGNVGGQYNTIGCTQIFAF
ncbi:15238_t:CDS:1, partial [Racocetra fulgida]